MKPAAAIMSAKTGRNDGRYMGSAEQAILGLMQMPIITSRYWNMVHGTTPQEVMQDHEGLCDSSNTGP